MCKFYNNNDKNNKKKPHYVRLLCAVNSARLFRFCFQPGHAKPPTRGNTQLLHKIDYMAPANQSGISDVIDSLTNTAATFQLHNIVDKVLKRGEYHIVSAQ